MSMFPFIELPSIMDHATTSVLKASKANHSQTKQLLSIREMFFKIVPVFRLSN